MSYLTLAAEVGAELEVKRSRFLATVRRVADEAAAMELVAEHRRAHHAARHHCSAFVIGPDQALVRASDDGEPAGTAGLPMLNVLTGITVSDVRYGSAEVLLTVAVEPGAVGSLHSLVASLTAGSAALEPAGQAWVDEPG